MKKDGWKKYDGRRLIDGMDEKWMKGDGWNAMDREWMERDGWGMDGK